MISKCSCLAMLLATLTSSNSTEYYHGHEVRFSDVVELHSPASFKPLYESQIWNKGVLLSFLFTE